MPSRANREKAGGVIGVILYGKDGMEFGGGGHRGAGEGPTGGGKGDVIFGWTARKFLIELR